jgi:hypothetical protein
MVNGGGVKTSFRSVFAEEKKGDESAFGVEVGNAGPD